MKKMLIIMGVALSSAAHSQTIHYSDSALYAMSLEQLKAIYKEKLYETRGERVFVYTKGIRNDGTPHTHCSGFGPAENAYIRSKEDDYPTEDVKLVWRIQRLQLINDK
ncbi:MAG: hypothetical protein ACU4F9_11175 [Arcticibacter sp.]